MLSATSSEGDGNDGSEGRGGKRDPLTERPNNPTSVKPDLDSSALPSSDQVSEGYRNSLLSEEEGQDVCDSGSSDGSSDPQTGVISHETDIEDKAPIDGNKCDEDSELKQPGSDDSIARAKAGFINLSDLPRTKDGGILIYPDIHLRNKQPAHSRDKPHPQDIGDADDQNSAARKEHDLHTLLHNIQKSHAKQEERVAEKRTSAMSIEELVHFLREQNARDVCVIELPPELGYVQYFVVCSGMGSRHIGRMADNLQAEVRKLTSEDVHY